MDIQEKINEQLDILGVDTANKGREWKGYDVYIPDTEKLGKYIGYPYVILVQGEEVRLSTVPESLEYLDFMNREDAKDLDVKELKEQQME